MRHPIKIIKSYSQVSTRIKDALRVGQKMDLKSSIVTHSRIPISGVSTYFLSSHSNKQL
jgi:hypothetical protein